MADPTPANPLSLLFLWALWGLFADYRYQRRGGQKPTRAERVGLTWAVGLCVGFVVLLGVGGASAAALGRLTGFLLQFVVCLWAFARWRVRRRLPAIQIPASR